MSSKLIIFIIVILLIYYYFYHYNDDNTSDHNQLNHLDDLNKNCKKSNYDIFYSEENQFSENTNYLITKSYNNLLSDL